MAKNVTIVVPVYGDWPSLSECVKSLKKYVDTKQHKIILVNDCGPEVETMEQNIKKAIKSASNFEYYRNSKNLGFVKTCNRAVFELDKSGNDVLLLNSDTRVTKGFLETMLAVLYGSPKIAAVCPRSNNATIFSVPIVAPKNKQYSMKDSYKIFKTINRHLPEKYLSPIAHGFCLLIKRDVINEYGLFDEIYGKGYGEENDFCLRVRREGYTCAVANQVFVFHFRARSFTAEKRDKLVEKNEKILNKRYPEYSKLMEEYSQRLDPWEWRIDTGTGPHKELINRVRNKSKRLFR